jgi:hypothetical protein
MVFPKQKQVKIKQETETNFNLYKKLNYCLQNSVITIYKILLI